MIIMNETYETAIGGINMSICLWGFDANSLNQWTPHLQGSLPLYGWQFSSGQTW